MWCFGVIPLPAVTTRIIFHLSRGSSWISHTCCINVYVVPSLMGNIRTYCRRSIHLNLPFSSCHLWFSNQIKPETFSNQALFALPDSFQESILCKKWVKTNQSRTEWTENTALTVLFCQLCPSKGVRFKKKPTVDRNGVINGPYKWTYQWVTGAITPINGVISPWN